jgi:flagellar FliL protein
MAVAEDVAAPPPKKKSALPLILGLVMALALGGGGFYAARSGMLDSVLGSGDGAEKDVPPEPLAPVSFVELEPLVITLGRSGATRHLRFRAHLEVAPGESAAVQGLAPRILDVVNGYLRAVPMEDLEDPAALIRLRAQLLRRVQLVVGDGRVRDLLIAEFVLN